MHRPGGHTLQPRRTPSGPPLEPRGANRGGAAASGGAQEGGEGAANEEATNGAGPSQEEATGGAGTSQEATVSYGIDRVATVGAVSREACPLPWVPLRIVANVPHVLAEFYGCPSGGELFMLDSGAGGVDVIFHDKAVEKMDLSNRIGTAGGLAQMRGVSNCATTNSTSSSGGGGGGGLQARQHKLQWLTLGGGTSFKNITALLPINSSFNLSEHTVGMICGDLLSKCDVVYDYPKRRVAIMEPRTLVEKLADNLENSRTKPPIP